LTLGSAHAHLYRMSLRILAAVDLSDAAADVLREARAIATARGGKLAAVHVATHLTDVRPLFPEQYSLNLVNPLELEQIAQQAFEKRLTELQGGDEIERFFERGEAYAEIVRRAEAWGDDLIVVGSHGETGLSRVLLGSVAERVARHAHCTVLCVRPSRGPGVVLAATDLSDPSLPAVACAAAEAKQRGARLIVAHATDTLLANYLASASVFFGSSVTLPSPEAQHQARANLLEVLRQAMAGLGAEGEPLVVDGSAVSGIVRAVDEQQADLLVVGTHGRTGLPRILLGSVAEQLVRLAPCSVLVARQAR
jgi:nucleotide-binding universal stress UspA family protein